MKSRLLLIIILTLFASSGFSQAPVNYDGLKRGKFEAIFNNNVIEDYVIIRKKTKQIEITNEGKTKIISEIEWTSDTTYTLTTLKHINVPEGCDTIGAVGYFTISKYVDDKAEVKWTQQGCGSGILTLRKI